MSFKAEWKGHIENLDILALNAVTQETTDRILQHKKELLHLVNIVVEERRSDGLTVD